MTSLNDAMMNVIQGRGDIREVSKALRMVKCPACFIGELKPASTASCTTSLLGWRTWGCDSCEYWEERA